MRHKSSIFSITIICVSFFVFIIPLQAANRVTELQQQITNQSNEIKHLETEIIKYQDQVIATGKQATTLQNTIKQLEITTKKLDTDIALTSKKIRSTVLQIEKLGLEIKASEMGINDNRQVIAEAIRQMKHEEDTNALLSSVLSGKHTGDIWSTFTTLSSFSTNIKNHVEDLRLIKINQETNKKAAEAAKKNLEALTIKLADQKKIADQNRKNTATLLTETKNQEANYRALLAQRLERKRQVEAEIKAAEEAIKVTINPTSIPRAGSGVLRWPLDKVVITQYFGNTPFATANPQIYKGTGHNAIDMSAPVGTPIKSAASGKVLGAGDTDLVCKGASYGRWIMIVHNNGLATIYAHLSLIKVTEGQTVGAGEIIGYSGNTGYSTGPHLHFSVLAAQGVSVGSVKSKVPGCGIYRVPLSPPNAYLNPLSYL